MNRHGNPGGVTRYAVNETTGKETRLWPGYERDRAVADRLVARLNTDSNDDTVYSVVIVKVA